MRGRLQFLLQGRFWLNYAVILAATSWLPLLEQTATMSGADGTVLKQTTSTLRAYQSWYALFSHGPDAGQGQAAALHLGLCFIVTAFVWLLMFKPIVQDLRESALELPCEGNAPSSGDTLHE
jgi:hypothetical protein